MGQLSIWRNVETVRFMKLNYSSLLPHHNFQALFSFLRYTSSFRFVLQTALKRRKHINIAGDCKSRKVFYLLSLLRVLSFNKQQRTATHTMTSHLDRRMNQTHAVMSLINWNSRNSHIVHYATSSFGLKPNWEMIILRDGTRRKKRRERWCAYICNCRSIR